MLEKIKFLLLFLPLLFSNSVLSSTLFIKNSLDFAGESASEEMKTFFSINKGGWIIIERFGMDRRFFSFLFFIYSVGDRLKLNHPTQATRWSR
ncbi:hypothetical protein BCU43_004100 [Vibrio lentus]